MSTIVPSPETDFQCDRMDVQDGVNAIRHEFYLTGKQLKHICISPQLVEIISRVPTDIWSTVSFSCFGVVMTMDKNLEGLNMRGVAEDETLLTRRQVVSKITDATEAVEDEYPVARIVVGDLMGRSIMAVLAEGDTEEEQVSRDKVLGYLWNVDYDLPPDYVLVYPCKEPTVEVSVSHGRSHDDGFHVETADTPIDL